jgi:CheY-like chemotaxis protein
MDKIYKILVVDDEQEVRDMYSENLSDFVSIKTFLASDGVEASLKAKNDSFDLIITDLKMPKADGIQFIKNLRNSESSKTEIFVTSGNITKDNLTEIINIDRGVKFFSNPIQLDVIFSEIKKLFVGEGEELL